MRSLVICLFLNLFVCVNLVAQKITRFPLHRQLLNPQSTSAFLTDSLHILSTLSVPANNKNHLLVIEPAYYYTSLGFFCKKELQLEKAVKFPVKLRLGDVSYTDRMEGKQSWFR